MADEALENHSLEHLIVTVYGCIENLSSISYKPLIRTLNCYQYMADEALENLSLEHLIVTSIWLMKH